ncbi:hypothetical protein CRM81_05485 [Yersinia kristensenii]|nr:hypothetical protein CRM81_05485 [Yersinia kristensenii]
MSTLIDSGARGGGNNPVSTTSYLPLEGSDGIQNLREQWMLASEHEKTIIPSNHFSGGTEYE